MIFLPHSLEISQSKIVFECFKLTLDNSLWNFFNPNNPLLCSRLYCTQHREVSHYHHFNLNEFFTHKIQFTGCKNCCRKCRSIKKEKRFHSFSHIRSRRFQVLHNMNLLNKFKMFIFIRLSFFIAENFSFWLSFFAFSRTLGVVHKITIF